MPVSGLASLPCRATLEWVCRGVRAVQNHVAASRISDRSACRACEHVQGSTTLHGRQHSTWMRRVYSLQTSVLVNIPRCRDLNSEELDVVLTVQSVQARKPAEFRVQSTSCLKVPVLLKHWPHLHLTGSSRSLALFSCNLLACVAVLLLAARRSLRSAGRSMRRATSSPSSHAHTARRLDRQLQACNCTGPQTSSSKPARPTTSEEKRQH